MKTKHTLPATIPHTPMTNRILNTADPTIVPIPISPFAINTAVKQG